MDFRKPKWSMHEIHNIRRIAALYARAWNADSFAFNRAVHYMIEGLEHPSDIEGEAKGLLTARDQAHDVHTA